MKKFRYMFVFGPGSQVEFNKLGDAGWELVTFFEDNGDRTWIFKQEAA